MEMQLSFVAPVQAIQTPTAQTLSTPALRASRVQEVGQDGSFQAVSTVCGLATIAAIAAGSRRRTALRAEAAVVPAHMKPAAGIGARRQIYSANSNGLFGDEIVPVPGSQLALEKMVGADVETSSKPWDPLGFSKLYDRNFDFNGAMTYPHVQWLREAELKHGRIAMLAFVGILVNHTLTLPGYPSVEDWTKALDACYQEKYPTLGVVQISGFIMIVEGKFFPRDSWIGAMDREPGALGFDPLKLSKGANFDSKAMQLKELKNGRLAMIGVAALAAAHNIPGSVPFLSAAVSALPKSSAASSASSFCGSSAAAAQPAVESKTTAHYTTQVILPALAWLKSGVKSSDLKPCQLKAVTLAGNDVLIGKTEGGKLFCVGNLCPHIGTPMSEGADVIGDVIVCPLHGSSFKVTTGELIDWCPSPPIIGPLTGFVIEKKNLLIFECRESGFFGGGDVEVLVDTNAKRAYEADYWKGLLDAQGKDDGSYY
jgi:nitrite reductase/ring-hydroxylating ferredoxin subunit